MNRHLFEPIGVQDAAAAASLSPSHFSRQFKARTGYSPYEYIVLRRIDKAKYMLASTELSVKEIAYADRLQQRGEFLTASARTGCSCTRNLSEVSGLTA